MAKTLIIGLAISLQTLCGCGKKIMHEKLNILIVTGGHDFEREPFFKMFDEMQNVRYTEIQQPAANGIYRSSEINNYDAIVFYDMVQEISTQQKEEWKNLLNKGKGHIFLHHSLVSHQNWDEFEKIIGGKYHLQDTLAADGGMINASTYLHDVEIPVTIADKNHPVTKNLDDFSIHDETYGGFTYLPTIHPLLKTEHPNSSDVIAWINVYGNAKIVYIQLGHDHFAYENPHFRELLQQAIRWVAEK